MELRLLGELEAVADDGSVLPVHGGKQRALLALLALHRGEAVSAERLIDALWGDEPPGNPANALQALIANLRRALGPAAVLTTDAGYSLTLALDDIDVVRFEQLVTQGRRSLDDGDPATAAAVLDEALALRRGDALAEFAFAEFADGERVRLDELVLIALEARIDARIQLGHHGDVVGELESLCAQHPLRERLWELRMLALYRGGRQAEALRVYSDAREQLVDELGIEPGPALRDLEARVLAQDPTLDAPATREPIAHTKSAGNLRERLTSFVGRDLDIEHLHTALQAHRLVTLIGPGGSGKTRLAVETAARLQPESPDGAWLVELAGVRDADAVMPALYSVLRAVESGSTEAERVGEPLLDRLSRQLADKSLVIVLDNCEHVIAEAATAAETLTGRVPGLFLVATSREALGVPGEMLVPVGGLDLDAAVQLFEDRAQAANPAFTVNESNRAQAEDVCRRLDGLPLAVELAAHRVCAAPLAQLASRLDDRFRVLTGGARTALPRQQTLRAVVDWSYDLLFEDERTLFARLSVFTGGCTLEAAEAVCADDALDRDDVCDLMLRLVDKSLVVADLRDDHGARYTQLQTLWQYGRERLAESKDAQPVRDRHARWYLDLAKQARTELRGPAGQVWHAQLGIDMDNLRAALDWFADQDDAASALFLVDGIAWSWFARNDPHEAVRWIGDALAVEGPVPPGFATVTVWRSYYRAGVEGPLAGVDDLKGAIAELRDGDHRHRLCEALLVLGELYNRANDVTGSLAAVEDVLSIVDETGDRWLYALAESLLSRNLAHLGRLEEAERAARASIEHLKEIGQDSMAFEGLGQLSLLLEASGDLVGAAAAYDEMLEQLREMRLPLYEHQWIMRLATVRARQGREEDAIALFGEHRSRVGVPASVAWSLVGEAGCVRRMGDLDTAALLLDEAAAIYESIDSVAGRVVTLVGRCWWAIGSGDLEAAAEFSNAALAYSERCSDLLLVVAAQTAVAAVDLLSSPSDAAAARWEAVLAERTRFAAGVYVALIGGAVSATLDEPDVAALVASLAV